MCVDIDVYEEITPEQLQMRYALPGFPLKRAEYHSELAGLRWSRTGMTRAVLANESLGVAWRIPKGEIWSLLAIRFQATVSAAVSWSAIAGQMNNALPICLNGLFDGSKYDKPTTLTAVLTNGASASINKTWGRQGLSVSGNIYWTKLCENQLVYVSAQVAGACNWTDTTLDLFYYRTRLYDKLLRDLRETQGNDCEVQKLLQAAFPWVNERNDSDW